MASSHASYGFRRTTALLREDHFEAQGGQLGSCSTHQRRFGNIRNIEPAREQAVRCARLEPNAILAAGLAGLQILSGGRTEHRDQQEYERAHHDELAHIHATNSETSTMNAALTDLLKNSFRSVHHRD